MKTGGVPWKISGERNYPDTANFLSLKLHLLIKVLECFIFFKPNRFLGLKKIKKQCSPLQNVSLAEKQTYLAKRGKWDPFSHFTAFCICVCNVFFLNLNVFRIPSHRFCFDRRAFYFCYSSKVNVEWLSLPLLVIQPLLS